MDKLSGFSQIPQEEIYKTSTDTTQQKLTKPALSQTDASIKSIVAKVIESSDDESDPDYSVAKKYVNDIRSLKVPVARPKVTPIATSTEDFLKELELEQNHENLFTQNDVDQIYDIIQSHPMSSEVTIHTLFEMQTFDLLFSIKSMKLLLTTKDIEWFLNQYKFTNLIFLLNYIESGEFDLKLIIEYTDALKKLLIDNLRNKKQKLEKAKTKLQMDVAEEYNKCKEEYGLKVLSFFNKWENNINLLKKFLSCIRLTSSAGESEIPIIIEPIGNIPGARTILQFSSFKDIQNLRKTLCKYINSKMEIVHLLSTKLSKRKIYARYWDGVTSSRFLKMFEKIQKEINSHQFEETQNIKKAKYQSEKLLKLVAHGLFDVQDYDKQFCIAYKEKPHENKNIPDDIKFGFLKCYYYWLFQIYTMFDHSILPLIYPEYATLKVHEARFHMTLRKFNSNFVSKYSMLDKVYNNPPWFNDIYREFYKNLQSISFDLKTIEKTGFECMDYNVRTYDFITDKIKQLYQKLKPIAESTLKELLEYAKEHPNAVCKLELTDMTIMLAKSLIMVGDLHMFINENKLWPHDLPEEYLEFVSMQNDTEIESDMSSEEAPHKLLQDEPSSKTTSSKPVEATPGEDLNSAFLHFNLDDLSEENKVPPRCLHSGLMALQDKVVRSSSKLTHKRLKPKEQKPTFSAEPRPTHTEKYIPLRHIKSAKKLQEVLSKIGLVSVPGKGSHTKWLYPESQTVATIVPNHDKDLGVGLRRALERQVNNNRPKE